MRTIAILLLAACSTRPQPVVAPSSPAAPDVAPAPVPAEDRGRPLRELVEADPRSVERATRAADAIGEAADARALDDLAALATRPPSEQLIVAQIAAIRALGKLKGQPRAVDALLAVCTRALPPHPRDPEEEDAYALALERVGAAVQGLAQHADARATPVLVGLIYRAPELSSQLRRAFAAFGPEPAKQFLAVLRGTHAELEKLIADERLDRACAPGGACQPLATRDFYAAMVLGDLRSVEAVPVLLEALARPALPIYVVDGQVSPNTQHDAIADALRRTWATAAGPVMRKRWSDPRLDPGARTLAAAVYPFVTSDGGGADALWAIATDPAADDGLRTEAATAFARLAVDVKHAARFVAAAREYEAASAKKRAAADKEQAKKTRADAALADAYDALERARARLLALAQDPTSTADQIRAGTAAAQRVNTDVQAALKKHRAQTAGWRVNDEAARAFRGYARMFQTHVARLELGSRCKADTKCYADAIAIDAPTAVARVKPLLPGVERWTEEEKQGLVEAYADRALLELGRRAATQQLDVVLAGLASENRIVREAILLALPRLAPSPCPACIVHLDAALEAGRGKAHLAALQIETEVVRNYLRAR